MKEFTIGRNDAGQRLDRFVSKAAPLIPESLLQKTLRKKDIKINGRPAKAFASQGQTRSAALALKFGQRELFFRDTGEYPVLLLDDVLSELDAPRQSFVASHAMGGQTIITCCEERQAFQNSRLIRL